MKEKLKPVDNGPKKDRAGSPLAPRSFTIDYANTGWEKINLAEQLPGLLRNAGVDGEILGYAELSGGYFNKVITVETTLTKVVVKISPLWNKGGLARENFAYANLKNLAGESFRLAKEYSYQSDDNSSLPGHEILVVEYIDGRKPTDSDLNSEKFHENSARFLDSIHSLSMAGYGWLDRNFKGKNKSWPEFLASVDNLGATQASGLLPEGDIDWLINKLIAETDSNFKPVLLYGDLKPENLLIKNGKIYPVDFGNCFSGDKNYDLGIGLFFNPRIWQHLNLYLKGDEAKKAKPLISLYAMRHAVSCLGHRVSIGDQAEAAAAVKRFFELKELHQKS